PAAQSDRTARSADHSFKLPFPSALSSGASCADCSGAVAPGPIAPTPEGTTQTPAQLFPPQSAGPPSAGGAAGSTLMMRATDRDASAPVDVTVPRTRPALSVAGSISTV